MTFATRAVTRVSRVGEVEQEEEGRTRARARVRTCVVHDTYIAIRDFREVCLLRGSWRCGGVLWLITGRARRGGTRDRSKDRKPAYPKA